MSEYNEGYAASGETAPGGNAVPEKENNYVAPLKGLVWIAIGVFIMGALLLVGLRTLLSVSEVRFARSDLNFVGMKNFQYVLSNEMFGRAFFISIIVHVVRLALCLGFGMIGAAIGRAGRAAKAIVGSLGLMLAFIPSIVWDALIFSSGVPTGREAALDLTARILLTAFPWIGLSLFLGAMLTAVWQGKAARAGLAAALLVMLTLMTGSLEQRAISYGGSGLTAKVRGLEDLIFLQAFQNGRLSVGAAAEVLRGLIGMTPMLAAAVLLAILLRGAQPKSAKIPVQSGHVMPSLFGGLIAGGVPLTLGVALIVFGRPSRGLSASVDAALAPSVTVLLLELFLSSGIYFGLLLCIGKLTHKSTFSLIMLLAFGSVLAGSSVARYYTTVNAGLTNTYYPIVMDAMFAPLPLTLLLSAALLRPRRVVTCLLLALGISCLAGVYAMGNLTNSLTYISAGKGVPVGMWLYRTITNNLGQEPIASAAGCVMMMVAVPIGVGAALTTSGTTRE